MKSSSIESFLKELGSVKPVPGGGAAAALAASIGVSLAEMTARINLKKRPEALARQRITKFAQIKRQLTALFGRDAAAFKKIISFPKEKRSGAAYEAALKNGADVPLRMCLLSAEALSLASAEKTRTGSWLISDLIESAILLEASYESARLNVEINLKSMTDTAYKREAVKKLELCRLQIAKHKKSITEGMR